MLCMGCATKYKNNFWFLESEACYVKILTESPTLKSELLSKAPKSTAPEEVAKRMCFGKSFYRERSVMTEEELRGINGNGPKDQEGSSIIQALRAVC